MVFAKLKEITVNILTKKDLELLTCRVGIMNWIHPLWVLEKVASSKEF
jgi:hypothetical protein